MPYYTETYSNREVIAARTNYLGVTDTHRVAMDSTELTGFRSRPSSAALSFTEKAAVQVDPYASFLDSTSSKKYRARLKERGLSPDASPDRGHAFELKKHTVHGKMHEWDYLDKTTGRNTRYSGYSIQPNSPVPTLHDGGIFKPATYQETGLDAFAQLAYARSAPSAAVFNASTFLGELNEGLPKLSSAVLQNGIKDFRDLGKDYLNVEFGWKPFVSSLYDMGMALKLATSQLAPQGQAVHRSYSLPAKREAQTTSSTGALGISSSNIRGFVAPSVPFQGSNPSGVQTTGPNASGDWMKTTSSQRWFEGLFTSFYPLDFAPDSYLSRLNVLADLSITPETLYELAPWSWLVDWNLRIGDSIHANLLRANDLLVMHYGYAMEHTVYTTECSFRVTGSTDTSTVKYTGFPPKGRLFASTVYKRRLRACPFGFKVNPTNSLSASQLGILGALGLTKTK